MGVTDFFAGEIATELLKILVNIVRKSSLCKSSAEQLINYINDLLPIIQEIKYSGVELPAHRQRQLDNLSETLRNGVELAGKVLNSGRWNVYRNMQLARKMEKLEKRVSMFLMGPLQAHVLADVHHLRFDQSASFNRLERQLGSMKIGAESEESGLLEAAVRRMAEEERWYEGKMGNLGVAMELAKREVKDMLIGRDDLSVVGICGIGGSGKTTLAREICRDVKIKSYFSDRVFFLTVSQSPNVEQLRQQIWGLVSNCKDTIGVPQWQLQDDWNDVGVARSLVVLDDVWSLSVLQQLIPRIPGCKTLVVSRFKFTTIINCIYKLELLREDEAMILFCHFAFGQNFVPPGANEKLVKQVVDECKGLPLALKVIGSSLRDQPELIWKCAQSRLSRSLPICESHETELIERMKLSIDCLPSDTHRECFLDLASFEEDKKIPLCVLVNMWVELHDINEEDAIFILTELANKNLLTLVKDSRVGDGDISYFEISISQHDVLRDLAIHLSNRGYVNDRSRLLMPSRERGIPREWARNADQPFNAQIVSLHTDGMTEMDWMSMAFPKAEVLILTFSSSEYFLPPFIDHMPKLRALILINTSNSIAVLHNTSVFSSLANLRSLWFERISFPPLPETTVPLKNLQRISLHLCKINNSLDQPAVDLPGLFPCLSELTLDHCINLAELPSSICQMQTLNSLTITNCDSLHELPSDLGKLKCLQSLRIYACPNLKNIPPGICDLIFLKYIDISQCVNLQCLPDGIGRCTSLEKIDMRECPQMKSLPKSVVGLRSLRLVICDEEISWLWRDVEKALQRLRIQVAEACFNLDWLTE